MLKISYFWIDEQSPGIIALGSYFPMFLRYPPYLQTVSTRSYFCSTFDDDKLGFDSIYRQVNNIKIVIKSAPINISPTHCSKTVLTKQNQSKCQKVFSSFSHFDRFTAATVVKLTTLREGDARPQRWVATPIIKQSFRSGRKFRTGRDDRIFTTRPQ